MQRMTETAVGPDRLSASRFIRPFSTISNADVAVVGGKNASLGEMYSRLTSAGILVPNGFAVTAEAYRYVLESNKLLPVLHEALDGLDWAKPEDFSKRSHRAHHALAHAVIPDDLRQEILTGYRALRAQYGESTTFAVRSSATAEDLPNATPASWRCSVRPWSAQNGTVVTWGYAAKRPPIIPRWPPILPGSGSIRSHSIPIASSKRCVGSPTQAQKNCNVRHEERKNIMSLTKPRNGNIATIDEVFEPLLDFTFPRFNYVGATPLDLYERDGKFVIELAAPGFEPRDINVEVSGNTVSLSGTHSERSDLKDARYHRREMRSGSFSRTVTLPQDLDANAVQASIDKGILKVELTPIKPLMPKRIEVKEG